MFRTKCELRAFCANARKYRYCVTLSKRWPAISTFLDAETRAKTEKQRGYSSDSPVVRNTDLQNFLAYDDAYVRGGKRLKINLMDGCFVDHPAGIDQPEQIGFCL